MFFSVSESRNWKEVIFRLKRKKSTANNSGCSIQERALNAVNCAPAEGVEERDWPPSL